MVVGHIKANRRDAPHVLFYGHYDVQPVDPLSLWRSPPFEPKLEAGPQGEQILARGASDDKGQLMTFLEACRAFKKFGGPPCQVTVLFEGEEETGSPSLPAFLAKNAKRLKADIALVCDTGMWGRWRRRRSRRRCADLVGEEVVLTGANRDLHSGLYGGLAVNPIHVLSRSSAPCTTATAASRCRASTTASKSSRGNRSSSGARSISTPWPLLARRRPDDAGRRARPHAARAALVAPDLRGQRHRRRLYRRGLQDRAAGQGERKGLVPAGRQAEPRARHPGLPRLRHVAPAAGRQGRIHRPRAEAPPFRCRSRTRPCAGRAARSRPNGGSRRRSSACGGSIPIVGAFKRELRWTACSSASLSKTTGSIRPTRNTSERPSTRAPAPGRASLRRWPRERERAPDGCGTRG